MTNLKKYSLLSVLMLTGLIFFTACGDDDDISKRTSLTGTWKVLDSDGDESLTLTANGGFTWSYQKGEDEYRLIGNYVYLLQGDKLTLTYKRSEKYNPATKAWEGLGSDDPEYPKDNVIIISDIELFTLKDGNIDFIYKLDHLSLNLTYNETGEDNNVIHSVEISLKRVK